jgi:ADP-heptose:LPS heptosyltransferase
VIVGGPGESEQVAELSAPDASSAGMVADLVGRTSVGQMLAVIAGAGVVIAHDSAPLHMAVGFDRPCVALFGPTDPVIVGPYRRPEAVVQAPEAMRRSGISYRSGKLGDELMRLITVEHVLERLDAVLGTSRQSDLHSARTTAREVTS